MSYTSLRILCLVLSLKSSSAQGLRNFEPHEMAMDSTFEATVNQQKDFEGRSGYAHSSHSASVNRHQQQRRPVSGWTAFTPAWLNDHAIGYQDNVRPTTLAPRDAPPQYRGPSLSYHAPALQEAPQWDSYEFPNQGYETQETVPVQRNPVTANDWHREEDWRQKTFFRPEQFQENAGISRPGPAVPVAHVQPKPQAESSHYDDRRPQSPPKNNNYYDYVDPPQQQAYLPEAPPPPYYPSSTAEEKYPEVAYVPPRQSAPKESYSNLPEKVPTAHRQPPAVQVPPKTYPSKAAVEKYPEVAYDPQRQPALKESYSSSPEKVPVVTRPSPPAQAPPQTYPSNNNPPPPNRHVPNPNHNQPKLQNSKNHNRAYPERPPQYQQYPAGPGQQRAPQNIPAEDPFKDLISLKRKNRPVPARTSTTHAPTYPVAPDPYKDLISYKRKPATQPPIPSYDESLDFQTPYLEPYNDVPAAPEDEAHPYAPPVLAEDSHPYPPPELTEDSHPYAQPELVEESEPEPAPPIVEETDDDSWHGPPPYQRPPPATEEDGGSLSLFTQLGTTAVPLSVRPVVQGSNTKASFPARYPPRPNTSLHTDDAETGHRDRVPSLDETEAVKFVPTTFRPTTTTTQQVVPTKTSTAPSLTRSRLKTRLPVTASRAGQNTQNVKKPGGLTSTKTEYISDVPKQDSSLVLMPGEPLFPDETPEAAPAPTKSPSITTPVTTTTAKTTKVDANGGRIAAYRQRLDQLREQANKNRDLPKNVHPKAGNDIPSSSSSNKPESTRGTTTSTTSTTRRPAVTRLRPKFPTRNRLSDGDQPKTLPKNDKEEEVKLIGRNQESSTEEQTTTTRRTFTPKWRSTTTTTRESPTIDESPTEASLGEDFQFPPYKPRDRPYRRKPGMRRRTTSTTESLLLSEEDDDEDYKVTQRKRASTSTAPTTTTTTETIAVSPESDGELKIEEINEPTEKDPIKGYSVTTSTSSTTAATTTASTTSTTESSSTWTNTPRTFGIEPWLGHSTVYDSDSLEIPEPVVIKTENLLQSESSLSAPKLANHPKFPPSLSDDEDEPVIELVELPAGVSTTQRAATADQEDQTPLKDILAKWRSSTTTTDPTTGQPWLQYTDHLFDASTAGFEDRRDDDSVEWLDKSDDVNDPSVVSTTTTTTTTTAKPDWELMRATQGPFLPIEQLLPLRPSTKKPRRKIPAPRPE